MKKAILLISVCLLFAIKGYSQFSFGVAPGLNTNTAYFGIKLGPIVPYVNFQYLGGSLKMESGGIEDKYSVKLIMPGVGAKFFFITKNKIKGYANLNVVKPFVSGKYVYDGDEVTEFADMIKDVSLIGGSFGFGVEYFFDDNFSIGGEYGAMYIHGKYDNSDMDLKVNLGAIPTYSKITLSYYFGGKGE
jgi:hypothetical protein